MKIEDAVADQVYESDYVKECSTCGVAMISDMDYERLDNAEQIWLTEHAIKPIDNDVWVLPKRGGAA